MSLGAAPIGAHTFIWSPRWDRMGAERAAKAAAATGYDFVEIPLLDPTVIDIGHTRALLADLGIGCSCSLALPANAHLPTFPEAGRAFLEKAVDAAASIGSPWLTGALYGHLGTLTGKAATEAELDTIAGVLRTVAERAADLGLDLGLEIINRYETYILNTVEQALTLVERIDAPNVFVHVDTFHLDIEEPSVPDAIRRLGSRLGYVHLAESHRGALGSGHVALDEVFAGLTSIAYEHPIVIEAFFNADPEIRRATASWRDHGLDPDDFARSSLKIVRDLVGATPS